LARGDQFWQPKVGLGGPNLAAKSGLGGPLFDRTTFGVTAPTKCTAFFELAREG